MKKISDLNFDDILKNQNISIKNRQNLKKNEDFSQNTPENKPQQINFPPLIRTIKKNEIPKSKYTLTRKSHIAKKLFSFQEEDELLSSYKNSITSTSLPSIDSQKFTSFKTTYEKIFSNFKEKFSSKTIIQEKKKNYEAFMVPEMKEDYYLNLLDWSTNSNILAYLLDNSVNFYNPQIKLSSPFDFTTPYGYFSSLKWNLTGDLIALGNSNGSLQIFDPSKNTIITEINQSNYNLNVNNNIANALIQEENNRLSSIAWQSNFIISLGYSNGEIITRDLRINNVSNENNYNIIFKNNSHHKKEICALKWSKDGLRLASGSNDKQLLIWNANSLLNFQLPEVNLKGHKAAVKAIDWSPYERGVICSGAGKNDQFIRFWDVLNCEIVDSVNSGSQISNLFYCNNSNRIITSHGFVDDNLICWERNLKQVCKFEGHKDKCLYLSQNPNENCFASAGGNDQVVKFWDLNFIDENEKKEGGNISCEEKDRI